MVWNEPGKPAKLYRYLTPRWADEMCRSGNVLIGTLESFRQAKGPQGDPLDSAASYFSGDMLISSTNIDTPELAALRHIGLHHGNTVHSTVSGARGRSGWNGVALCCCTRPDNRHFLDGEKNAVVEIMDPDAFVRAIYDAVPDIGLLCTGDPVSYADDRTSEGAVMMPDPHPFKKTTAFQNEREYRLFWPNAVGGPFNPISPAIAATVRRVT